MLVAHIDDVLVTHMDEPLAFLLTFRTYGTWLHGDERGSVDRDHNTPGTPMLAPDPARQAACAARMRKDALRLTEDMRDAVRQAILAEARFRGWELIRVAVRTNHVHVIVAYAGVRPELMAGRLKSHATRALRRHGLVGADQPVWADGPGSRRYLWKPRHIADAEAYVREGQDVPR